MFFVPFQFQMFFFISLVCFLLVFVDGSYLFGFVRARKMQSRDFAGQKKNLALLQVFIQNK